MIEQKDAISIDSRKVTPVTRSAEAGPEFTVEKVEKYDEATLTVTASATEVEGLPSSVAKDLACQVAVVFNKTQKTETVVRADTAEFASLPTVLWTEIKIMTFPREYSSKCCYRIRLKRL